jgi:hypothetical protein
LVVKSDFDLSRSEGARASPTKSNYSKISFHFCKDCRIFCEGEWEWDVKDDGDAVIKQQSANENYNWDSCWSVKADTKAISEMRSIPSKSKNALPFNGKSKTSFDCTSASTFQLIVGSKQLAQRKPQQFLVTVWLLNAISHHGPNQHKPSCISLLAVRAKSRSEVQRHVKFIVEFVSEGAPNALNTLQTFAEGDQAAPQNANLQTTNCF